MKLSRQETPNSVSTGLRSTVFGEKGVKDGAGCCPKIKIVANI